MNVLVIGSGGREHALAWRLAQSPSAKIIYAAPGNPGIGQVAQLLPGTDYLRMAREFDIDLTVVGPEAPLMDGVVDAFRAEGRLIFGPTAAAAQLEGSKIFSKRFFTKYCIPTAKHETANNVAEALDSIKRFDAPIVLKADGLAAGKGVVIASTKAEAEDSARALLSGSLAGAAGKRIVIEEFLSGEEVSFIALSDGTRLLPLLPAQDHKAVFDGNQGPNTGGMGAYVDERILTTQQINQIMTQILEPTLSGMRAEGHPFTGFLYAGLMMTASGPMLLEYNVRLGDPETQPLMYRLQSDLALVLQAGAAGNLEGIRLEWSAEPAVAVVLAAAGYPATPRKGHVIRGIDAAEHTGAVVFQAGTTRTPDGELRTAGGRVLAVTCGAPTLPEAIGKTYAAVERIHFDGMHFRKDIGGKGLARW